MTDTRQLTTLTGVMPSESHLTAAEPRKFRPIVVWAVIGAFFVAFQAYLYANWIVSGQAVRTPAGTDPVPTPMKIGALAWMVLGAVALAAFVWFYLIKPWRREGHLTLDGMFVIAMVLVYWQDAIANYFQWHVMYNSVFPNWGSWGEGMPGWMTPNGHLFPEPIFAIGPVYVYAVFGMMVVGCLVMRRAKARWPRLGPGGLVAICAAFFLVFDTTLEPLFTFSGFFFYPHAIPGWWTLFGGHYYQYPLYESVIWGLCWTALTCLRYFKDDKGNTVAERGVDRLAVGPGAKTAIRLLAIVGVTNVIVFFYLVGATPFELHSGAWPKDITSRSYLTNGVCGKGTAYACPGPNIPTNKPGSVHVGPDGQLVVPKGAAGYVDPPGGR